MWSRMSTCGLRQLISLVTSPVTSRCCRSPLTVWVSNYLNHGSSSLPILYHIDENSKREVNRQRILSKSLLPFRNPAGQLLYKKPAVLVRIRRCRDFIFKPGRDRRRTRTTSPYGLAPCTATPWPTLLFTAMSPLPLQTVAGCWFTFATAPQLVM